MESMAMVPSGMAMEKVDPAAVAAAETAKALIQSAYIMALKKPRNEDASRVAILNACRRPEFAKAVEYNKPVGGSTIRGASIRFAEVALSKWGNVRTVSSIIFEDDYVRKIHVSVTDLETNTAFEKDVSIRKTVERRSNKDREIVGQRTNTNGDTVYIVRATEDELANKEAASIAKCIRNEGLRFIPKDIIDEAIAIARKTVADKDAIDPEKTKKAMIDAFSQIGVTPPDLEKYLGHSVAQIVPAEIQELRAIYNTIKDGEAKFSDYLEDGAIETKTKEAAANEHVAAKSAEKLDNLKEKIAGQRGRKSKVQEQPPQETPPVIPPEAEIPEGEEPWSEGEKAVEVTEETKPVKQSRTAMNLSMMQGM